MVSSSTVLLGSPAVHACTSSSLSLKFQHFVSLRFHHQKRLVFFIVGICEKQRILAIMGYITLPITRLPLLNPTSSSSFSLPPPPLSNPRRRSNFSPLVITDSAVFAAPSDVNNSVPGKNGGYTVVDLMYGLSAHNQPPPCSREEDTRPK
ncbi:hypothetical protein YC2023_060734 [Brassica napus]